MPPPAASAKDGTVCLLPWVPPALPQDGVGPGWQTPSATGPGARAAPRAAVELVAGPPQLPRPVCPGPARTHFLYSKKCSAAWLSHTIRGLCSFSVWMYLGRPGGGTCVAALPSVCCPSPPDALPQPGPLD